MTGRNTLTHIALMLTLLGGQLPALAQPTSPPPNGPRPDNAAPSAEDANALERANALNQQVIELYRAGRYGEAIPLATEALRIRETALGPEHPDVATSLNNLAELYKGQGNYSAAEPLYQRALRVWEAALGPDHPDVANSLNNLALLYSDQGNYSAAEPLYQRALRVWEAALGSDHPLVATSLNNLALLYKAQGNYGAAEPLYQRALRIRETALGPDHPDVANSLNNLARLYYDQGNYGAAEPLLQRALRILETALGPDHPLVATSLNNLAELYQSQGNYGAAEPLLQRALRILETALGPDHPWMATGLNNLARLYYDQGNYGAAEPLLQRALRTYETALGPDHPDLATSLNNLAALYRDQGNYGAAAPLFQRALRIYETALGPDHPDVANSLNNLAGLYYDQGNYGAAEPLLQRALRIYETALGPDHPNVANSLNNLAELYQSQGNYGAAEPLLQQALRIYETALGPDHSSVARSLNNLAGLYQSQGNYGAAEPLFQRALKILETALSPDHPDVATSLNNLARLYRAQGNYGAAEPLFQRALRIYETALGPDHPDVATSLNNLAVFYQVQDNYGAVEPLFQRALRIYETALGPEHPDVAQSLNNLAALYADQGNVAEAVSYLARGLEIEEQHLDINLALLADAQRQAYVATLSGTTDWSISLNLQSAPTDAAATQLALTTLLRRKGRILEAGTSSWQGLRQNLNASDQATFDEFTAIREDLARLTFNPPAQLSPAQYQAELTRLETVASQLESQLARRSVAFRAETQPVEIAAVQAQLPADGVLVEYVRYRPFDATNPQNRWGAERYAAYLLFPDGAIQAVDLGPAADIDAAVPDFIGLLQDRSTTLRAGARPTRYDADIEAITGTIKRLIFDPIAPYLQDRSHLLISPDSQLNRIPFEALQAETSGPFLVEQYQISYLNSGRDLLKFDVTEPSQQPAVVLADPDYEQASGPPRPGLGEGLGVRASQQRSSELSQLQVGPLPGTAAEAEAIRPLLPNATVLTQTNATENALKQVDSPRILHIATHGFFLANVARPTLEEGRGLGIFATDSPLPQAPAVTVENPLLRSGLALAGFNGRASGEEDGVLTALEASQLNLFGTQLVVLSACETGLGDIANGDGVYGLRRAFAIAGAETQLMSLWQVDDFGTQSLMVRYYEKLTAGMGRSEALREVQLEMINSQGRYAHPFYWAAFITTGDWRPLE
jgi:tetratricopeptide (TPR) repeat protein/CHAT domain-containing protein